MAKGGLAAWSVRHPVSILMLTLTVVVLGFFALGRLSIDLLPQLIYPQIGVRILDPGVSATIMEDKVTRQLEEQLAITENAIGIESSTTEGKTKIELHFDYGSDIDLSLRDASTRLDRAKRFMPSTIDPPIIFKRDPAQLPVMEFSVSSPLRDAVGLRTWTDDIFVKRFLNLPGVASIEVGGGVLREIHILPDQRRLAGLGLSIEDLINAVKKGNEETSAGRLRTGAQEFGSRTAGRLRSVGAIATLPIRLPSGDSIQLSEVASVIDTHEDERLRVRFNGTPGVKISIQKQPESNTVDVARQVKIKLAWMQANNQIPQDIRVDLVSDQSLYIRHSLNNATMAAISGAILAMIVVYLFLGDIRGTLIIGSAIPISIMVTFVIMALSGLTLNIMTLGGLALGVGMLIDNTIVMLENIARHKKTAQTNRQEADKDSTESDADQIEKTEQRAVLASQAAAEVNSAIVASTTTNLAAVVPFIFIGGFIGLLFSELIITISAAIVASLVIAITLVPSLAATMRLRGETRIRRWVDGLLEKVQIRYRASMEYVLANPWRVIASVVGVFILTLAFLGLSHREENLPAMDDGNVVVRVITDPGVTLDSMDKTVARIEDIIHAQGDVESVFAIIGGWVFGRTQYETSNKSSLKVQLVPKGKRHLSREAWIKKLNKAVAKAKIAGVKVRARVGGIRGFRGGRRTEDDISIRITGPEIDGLMKYGDEFVNRLHGIKGIRNVKHSSEEVRQEFAIEIDRKRAAEMGIEVTHISRALQIALDGVIVSDFIEGDRSFAIRVRLPREQFNNPAAMESILLFGESKNKPAVYLRDVTKITLVPAPVEIKRENQQRMIEVSASLTGDQTLGEVTDKVRKALADVRLGKFYNWYVAGAGESLRRDKGQAKILLGLAIFLVYVVMAVHYESLRNPTVIMLSVPFSLIGVALALLVTGLSMSLPVWLGIIMLVGIVVNNAIVLVEYIELIRRRGTALLAAIFEAGRLRLRPIMMTTLTTVVGMLPLALGLGEGSEMLQPLAITIVAGLSFSFFISLGVVPAIYFLLHRQGKEPKAASP